METQTYNTFKENLTPELIKALVEDHDLDIENTESTMTKIANEALELVRNYFDMDYAFVSEFRDGQRIFRHVRTCIGNPVIQEGDGNPLEDSYCQRVVDGRLPEFIPDAGQVPEALTLPVTRALPVGAHLSVPVRFSDGTVFGTFCCFSSEARTDLDESSMVVMHLFADFVGIQLERFTRRFHSNEYIRHSIHSAIRDKAFHPVYQPIYNLKTQRTVGYETLTRFTGTPEKPPNAWFQDAQRVGLSARLELEAMQLALENLSSLPADAFVSVNLSPANLYNPAIVDSLKSQPLKRLALELTENISIADYPALNERLHPLRKKGLKIILDDVGAGSASLRHVLQLNPDIIKLDRSLVSRINKKKMNFSLASAITGFARNTGIDVIAMGVESQAELAVLPSLNVTHAQGYHICEPLPVDRIGEWRGFPT